MTIQERIIRDITDFIFLEDEPKPSDAIFIPGSAWPEMPEHAAELYRQGFTPVIVPSGKYSYKAGRFSGPKSKRGIYPGDYETEWEFERAVLIQNGVPERAILREDQSTHTVDKAFFTRKAVEAAGLAICSAMICCKPYHARRCLMTYGWAFPGVELRICPAAAEGLTRDNWHLTAHGRERVLGEVSKCGSYFKDVEELFYQGQ